MSSKSSEELGSEGVRFLAGCAWSEKGQVAHMHNLSRSTVTWHGHFGTVLVKSEIAPERVTVSGDTVSERPGHPQTNL